jgi:type II secretory pathway pseudopilin PulG
MPATSIARRDTQAGYTLLLVMFMVAVMLVTASAITPNLLTEGRREKEKEMVWRGNQYVRAIGLYYKKFGKYPTRIEDLTRQTNGLRFLRQAYKDPMNKDDGSWRFIYVGPNGQLVGSLKQVSLLQTTLSIPGTGGALGAGLGGGLQPLASPGIGQNQQGQQNGLQTGTGAAGQQNANPASAANPLESQPEAFQGAVLGGNIIGVGSKIKQPSFRVYLGGDKYQLWEFIWNPTGQIALPATAPVNPNGNPTGTNPAGAYPNGANPTGTNPNPSGTNPNGTNPNPNNPNPPDGSQPQNPQAPVTAPSPSPMQ